MVVVKPIKQAKIISQKISTGSNLSCIRQVLTLDKFATGGEENPLKLWDLETGKAEFTAKSVSFYFIFLFLLNSMNMLYFIFTFVIDGTYFVNSMYFSNVNSFKGSYLFCFIIFSLNQICFNSNNLVMCLTFNFLITIK